MPSEKLAYQPVERSSEETSSEDLPDGVLLDHYAANRGRQRWGRLIWIVAILAIVVNNAVWFGFYNRQNDKHPEDNDNGPPNEFGLLVPYEFSTPYVDSDIKTQNSLWAEMFPPGFGAIRVDHDWAAEHNLPKSQGNASDGKAIYTVSVFHHLHCLTVIRTSLFQFNKGRDQIDPWSHITHCLDAIRQEVLCLADPTIGGVGVSHQCRDFEALKAWTAERAYIDFLDDL